MNYLTTLISDSLMLELWLMANDKTYIQGASSRWSKRGSAQCTIIYASWPHGLGIGT
jgi:hypothetical protein